MCCYGKGIVHIAEMLAQRDGSEALKVFVGKFIEMRLSLTFSLLRIKRNQVNDRLPRPYLTHTITPATILNG